MMDKWLVLIQGREYRVEAETYVKAIHKAANLYRDETGAPYTIALIAALASARNLNRKRRRNHEELVLEVKNASKS